MVKACTSTKYWFCVSDFTGLVGAFLGTLGTGPIFSGATVVAQIMGF